MDGSRDEIPAPRRGKRVNDDVKRARGPAPHARHAPPVGRAPPRAAEAGAWRWSVEAARRARARLLSRYFANITISVKP